MGCSLGSSYIIDGFLDDSRRIINVLFGFHNMILRMVRVIKNVISKFICLHFLFWSRNTRRTVGLIDFLIVIYAPYFSSIKLRWRSFDRRGNVKCIFTLIKSICFFQFWTWHSTVIRTQYIAWLLCIALKSWSWRRRLRHYCATIPFACKDVSWCSPQALMILNF